VSTLFPPPTPQERVLYLLYAGEGALGFGLSPAPTPRRFPFDFPLETRDRLRRGEPEQGRIYGAARARDGRRDAGSHSTEVTRDRGDTAGIRVRDASLVRLSLAEKVGCQGVYKGDGGRGKGTQRV
jgi:hypothetical protein